MKFSIPVSPVSVNKLYRGRRFKTEDYENFEDEVYYAIGKSKQKNAGELFVRYTFYIKNYSRADTANLEKGLSDILSKLGYFENDNDIKMILMVKEKTNDKEYIEVEILPYAKNHPCG